VDAHIEFKLKQMQIFINVMLTNALNLMSHHLLLVFFAKKRKQKVLLHSNIKVIQTAQYLKQKASLKQELDENTIMVILDFSQLNEDIYILFVRKNKRTTLLL